MMKDRTELSNEKDGLRLGVVGKHGICSFCLGNETVPYGFNLLGYTVTLSTKLTEDCPLCLGSGKQLR